MNVAEATTQVPHSEWTPGHRPVRTRASAEERLPAYTTREFLDDQRWLLRQLDASGPFEERVEHLDGWYVVLHREAARLDVREAKAMFQERFGSGSGLRRLGVFLATSRFLDRHRADIVRSGLSMRGDPMEVREELVGFLIARFSRPGKEIPDCALTRFLDEWGHRWI